MDRRAVLSIGALALAGPRALLAQTAKRVYRVAILDDATEGSRRDTWAVFRKRLSALGWSEGKNLVLDARFAAGVNERLPALAGELVATKPDAIVAPSTPTARAAIRATSSIPIIFIGAGDPVGTGLVTTLAHPGGNATGISAVAPDTIQKSFEMLRELAPAVQRIGFLTDPAGQVAAVAYTRLAETAAKLKLSTQLLDGIGRSAVDRAFATIKRDRIQGLLVSTSGTLLDHRDEILEFVAREKIPAVYGREEWVRAGGLLSYGANRRATYERGADIVHKVLKGAKPADIPVEQVATVHTALNMKTARALGIKVPDSIRLRVDEVIE